jgi:hypothetical protein
MRLAQSVCAMQWAWILFLAAGGTGFAPFLIFHVASRMSLKWKKAMDGFYHGQLGDPVTAIILRVLAAIEAGDEPFTTITLAYE